ncbi:hypothetical protein LZ31DRAFT_596480 [Colletotrichum somersetense]|nr:hypothetical protein LZ31DRAFT_596480 [Colletotrichum somersetense]
MVFAIVDRSWTPDGNGNGDKDGVENKEDGDEEEEDEVEEDVDEEGEYEGGYFLIDGSDRRYVGWMYCNAFYVGVIYEDLHQAGLDNYISYQRPPSIYPRDPRSMPSC